MSSFLCEELAGLSFPDCKITGFRLRDESLQMSADGVYTDAWGLRIGPLHLIISQWQHLRIRRFNDALVNVEAREAGRLGEVCEVLIGNETLQLSGFEVGSGLWQEYEFTSPKVRLRFERH